ncbi:MAG: hypothetical protein V3R77_00635, partial [Candidatus Binatia bacterium]
FRERPDGGPAGAAPSAPAECGRCYRSDIRREQHHPRGEERWVCYRECAAVAHEHGRQCKKTLRRCALDCREILSDDGTGGVDDTP